MKNSTHIRVHADFERVIDELTQEINKRNNNGKVSHVEVSRAIACYLELISIDDFIKDIKKCKPNGSKFNITLVPRFPGSGLMDI